MPLRQAGIDSFSCFGARDECPKHLRSPRAPLWQGEMEDLDNLRAMYGQHPLTAHHL
jgi:hypothetical protein